MSTLWSDIYDLLINLIGTGGLYEWGDYTCQVFATIAVIFVFVVPFIIVFRVIKLLTQR